MKILMVNKFLFPNGGSETYMFELGKALQAAGNKVQYFGMEHEGRCVGNHAEAYTSSMDFHGGSKLKKLTYPLKTIYSTEARKKIRLVLDDFQPDIVHLNNFNYQLTPSVILEIADWRKHAGKPCKIVYTAHDFQLVCPNHMLFDPGAGHVCEDCLGGHFSACSKHACIHGSKAKSAVGTMEAEYWKARRAYKYLDKVICPSAFVKSKLDSSPVLASKTVVVPNFITLPEGTDDASEFTAQLPGKYVLYFGRYSAEKGFNTMLSAVRECADVNFVFAGGGPLESELEGLPNVMNAGFRSGNQLCELISRAEVCLCPSEWYEVFGLTVGEAMKLGTSVIGTTMGAIPENIKDGENGILIPPGEPMMLTRAILKLWHEPEMSAKLSQGAKETEYLSAEDYLKTLREIV